MKKYNKKEIIEFLEESNHIEQEYGQLSLQQSLLAWEYLKKLKKLTVSSILKTHKILMLYQPLYPNEKGYFRRYEVTVGGRFGLNWIKVPDATKAWVKLINHKTNNEDDIKFHHIEFEKIHPFVDGNGRTGRLLMTWERMQAGLPLLIIHADWPKEDGEQKSYYKWFKD